MEPTIISASRREDIPAFRVDWLLNAIARGWVTVPSPYAEYQVSFSKAELFVFWTKNPKPLIPHLDAFPYPCYFQYTLNDYPEYEHNVPSLDERIQTFKELSDKIGRERVIWRFDPIIVDKNICVNDVLLRIANIGSLIHPYTEKLVFSFIDPYKKLGDAFVTIPEDAKIAIADGIIEMNKNWKLELATCAENFKMEGISSNRCIDPVLVEKILGHNIGKGTKDPKQRPLCGCMASGDIGTFRVCRHRCDYCYAQ